jgi:hypothetical protein
MENIKNDVRNGYLEFKQLYNGSTKMIINCLNKLKEDGLLRYLIGMEELTQIENGYINSILNNNLKEEIIYHPLNIEDYEIKQSEFRVSPNHPLTYMFYFNSDCIESVQAFSKEEAYQIFVEICNKNKGEYFERKSIVYK